MYWLFIWITASLLTLYCVLILVYRQWLVRLPLFHLSNSTVPSHRFSVIIPARNEEAVIGACLQSVLTQQYPVSLFEVIVIDDHSTDRTASIIQDFQQHYKNLHLLNLADHTKKGVLNSYKKKAIEIAVSVAQYEWILTTDADCTVTHQWLKAYDDCIQQKDAVFVAAPVCFAERGTFLSRFQQLDFISLQAITAAAVSAGIHSMCNGANIAYRKDVFEEVGRFRGVDALASGDDMFLMHKIKTRYPDRLDYLYAQEAIVTTAPMRSWKDFLNQRIRWASKADAYQDTSIFWSLLLVYLTNAALFIALIWGCFADNGIKNWLILILAKTVMELSLMIPAARFYERGDSLWWFPLMQPFHITYTVIAGWLGKFGSYQWKGRQVK
jgi:cellulose synthase/poly-beta-1,6-N-acetylglucosamine synthase-like glycosyltransferase